MNVVSSSRPESSILAFARQLLVSLLWLLIASCGGDGGRDDPIQPSPSLGNDASLSSLTISGFTLDPEFSSSVSNYTLTVSISTISVDVDATASDDNASLTINGGTTTNVPLTVGENTIAILVTAENGTTTRTYTIVVTRPGADNANLRSLGLSNATLSPRFDNRRFDYTSSVPSGTTSVDVNATTADDDSSLTINGGTTTNVPLTVGENTITILVTAENGTTTLTYTIVVTRLGADNANLSSLELPIATWAPPFDGSQFDHTTTVGFFSTSTQVTPTTEDADATISVNGIAVASGATSDPIALAEGSNIILVNVTSADGTTAQTYTVVVNRQSAMAVAQTAYVKASNTGEGDDFGWSVSLSGDGLTLAVGARMEDSAATGVNEDEVDNSDVNSGAVYVFVRNSAGNWALQAYVKSSERSVIGANVEVGDLFGASVALSRDGATLAVGAPVESGGIWGDVFPFDMGTGAVYVFTRDGVGAWTQQSFIKPSNMCCGSFFGGAVALSGDGSTLAAIASGTVYLFARDGGLWTQQAEIELEVLSDWLSSCPVWHCLADSLALSDDGATLAASSPVGVYLFARDGGLWTQQSLINPPIGRKVALSGDGATLAGSSGGAVYLFDRDGGLWSQRSFIRASNTEFRFTNTPFGLPVALSGDGALLAVGVTREDSAATGVDGDETDTNATNSGAVYLFTRDGNGLWNTRTYVKASNTDAGDSFGASIALSADGATLVVGANGEDSSAIFINGDETDNNASDSGSVYIFEL